MALVKEMDSIETSTCNYPAMQFWNFCQQDLFTDIKIVSKNGCINAHRMFLHMCSPGLLDSEMDVLLLPDSEVTGLAQALKEFYIAFDSVKLKKHLDVWKGENLQQSESLMKSVPKCEKNYNIMKHEENLRHDEEEDDFINEDLLDNEWDLKEESRFSEENEDFENGLKYNCTICNVFIGEKNFYSKNLNHMSQTHGIPIKCKNCEEIFTLYHKLLRHNQKVHKQKHSFKYSCDKCGAKYKVKHAFEQHLLDCGIKTFPCDICGKTLVDQKGLSNHKRVIHNSNYGNFECNVCGKLCTTKLSLRDHIQAVHEKAHRISCHICGKVLHNKAVLKKHIKAIHENIRNYKCDHCDYRSISNQGLQKHVDGFHLGIKLECDECSQFYSNKFALETHKKNVHRNLQPSHACAECSNVYKSKSGLKTHIANSHSNRIFQCELCQKVLKTKDSLDYHMKSHNTEEQFQCNSCDRKFVTKTKLKMHMNTHTGELPYKCLNPSCHKAYASNDQLWHHKKNCKAT